MAYDLLDRDRAPLAANQLEDETGEDADTKPDTGTGEGVEEPEEELEEEEEDDEGTME